MAVWPGLGVNYASLNKVSQDIKYFQDMGLKKIRTHSDIMSFPVSMAQWLVVAQQFKAAGFYVVFGGSCSLVANAITSANWPTYVSDTLTQATLANGLVDEFQLGNEIEGKQDGSLTYVEVRNNIRALATSVKAVFKGTVSYSTQAGTTNGSDAWASEGKGNLDRIGLNIYGNVSGNQCDPANYKARIPIFYSAFGNNSYLSEFNLDASNTLLNAMDDEAYTIEMYKMLNYIKGSGMPSAYLYQYRSYKDRDPDTDYNARYSDDSFRLMWNPLASNSGRRAFIL